MKPRRYTRIFFISSDSIFSRYLYRRMSLIMTLSHCLILARSLASCSLRVNYVEYETKGDQWSSKSDLKDTGAGGDRPLVAILLYAAAGGEQPACDQDLQERLQRNQDKKVKDKKVKVRSP